MERIKLAISKARESASQAQQAPQHAALGTEAAPSIAARAALHEDRGAVHASGRLQPGLRSWRWAGVLLLSLTAAMVAWVLRPDAGAVSMAAALSAEAAPVPRVAVSVPVRPAAPDRPAEPRRAIPASAGVPDPAAKAPEAPVAPVQPVNDQLVAAVEGWRQAWSKRDMTNYLDAYSDAFTPPDGSSREDWIASRYRNVGGRKSIDVQIQRLLVVTADEGRARVSFLQDYTSGNVREVKRPKTLDLVRGADSRWRIVGEWQGDPPPSAGVGKSSG